MRQRKKLPKKLQIKGQALTLEEFAQQCFDAIIAKSRKAHNRIKKHHDEDEDTDAR